jgi:hypothetical protein
MPFNLHLGNIIKVKINIVRICYKIDVLGLAYLGCAQ